ncbi:MAG: alpha/beta hydrolase family protein [Capsulimonadaceae bacterium]|nr:alpha/beta hydrolase family protein [Capsulimonadaceae bacterium]
MAFSEFHLSQTNSLSKMVSFHAIVPQGKKGPFPVLYLLHGMSDNNTAWTRRTSIERYVEDLPLIVVMPDGDRSFYCDAIERPTWKYESYITSDLIDFVDETFRTVRSPKGRAIAGLSMGGYGAMKLALKFPKLFGVGISYSGALLAAARSESPEWSASKEWTDIFGPAPKGGPNDTLALAEAAAGKGNAPALWIDCGSSDFLIEENRAFHEHLNRLGIAHEYSEHEGAHSWDYWDAALLRTLPWLKERLGIAPPR